MARKNPLRILYYGCHEVLEFDDLRMFTMQGHSVFSLGHYCAPGSLGSYRNPLPEFFSPDDYDAFVACGCTGPADVTADFASRFDIAIVNHDAKWVHLALAIMNGRPVVYRTLGQSTIGTEAHVAPVRDQITVVRYSNAEVNLPGFMSSDAVIYFGKYRKDFGEPWCGGDRFVTFHNAFIGRSHAGAPTVDQYRAIERSFPMDLWGSVNQGIESDRGVAPAVDQASIIRNSAGYFYIPTVPPSYTLGFIEAAAAGAPIIAPTAAFIEANVDREYLNAACFSAKRWEVPQLLGENSGLLYDDLEGAFNVLSRLRQDHAFAQASSMRVLELFHEKFDAIKVAQAWDDLFYRLHTT